MTTTVYRPSVIYTESQTILGDFSISGDLTVDTTTLVIDSANNRVGIKTTPTSDDVEILGNITVNPAFTGNGQIRFGAGTAGLSRMIASDGADAGYIDYHHDMDYYSFLTAVHENLRIDSSSTAGDTRLLIWDVDNATLERVTVGAADSGGAGFKVLRIPN